MEIKKRKAVNFDLDTDLLIQHHPSHTDKTAYGQIKNYMEQNGFIHRQYSGYNSKERMSDTEITYILQGLFNKYSWMDECAKVVDITNIGETYSFLDIRRKTIDLEQNKSISINKEHFQQAIAEYIDYHNNRRIQKKTKWMPPSKFREASIKQ